MSSGVSTDRLAMLRQRWESDPTSRIFLQLAEEHRHLGQIQEALAVLDRGLQEHPGYLSALVAKGRCLLELGEPAAARAVLERVLKQDATQMVANKLLVRAHLETGEPGRARERLDLYRLLNDSDPEIEVLRRRIQAMEQPSKPPMPETFPEAEAFAPSQVFPDLGGAPRRDSPLDATDIFGLSEGRGATPAAPLLGESAEGADPAADAPARPAEPAAAAPPTRSFSTPSGAEEIFPDLHSSFARDRYLSGLSAEGLFPLPPPPAPPQAEPVALHDAAPLPEAVETPPPPVTERLDFAPPEPEAVEPFVPAEAAPAPAPAWEEPELRLPDLEPAVQEEVPVAFEPAPPPAPRPLVEPRSWNLDAEEPAFELEAEAPPPFEPAPRAEAQGRPVEAEPEPEEDSAPMPPAAPLAPVTPLATVTLADIYVKQGHPAEAERIYLEVLRREPGNAAAQAGFDRLARMERRLRPIEAGDLLADYQEPASGGGHSSRLRHLLQSYVKRVRERSQRDVS